MMRIRLPHGEWEYDPNAPLGPAGGFGAVFAGTGEGYGSVAIKRLHLSASDAAHRELRIADELSQRQLGHVIPVFDAGQDPDSGSYFIVMACADRSLQQEISRRGSFSESEAVEILHEIAAGLAEVRTIVHRDLKPANVLYHEGHWKVADFGIARFIEESTSLHTLKECLSPQYAAPEQWRLERATPATDIYALGCVFYTLLTGKPPFPGPKLADYKDQHLYRDPQPLAGTDARLRSLVAMMLRKAPDARPSLERVVSLLDSIAAEDTKEDAGQGLSALAQAGASAAEAAVHADASRLEQETKRQAREELARLAFQILFDLVEVLFGKILKTAPIAVRTGDRTRRHRIQLGSASLGIEPLRGSLSIPEDAFLQSGWKVVAGAVIRVIQKEPRPYEWSANLWYAKLGSDQDYRWWEVLYMTMGGVRRCPYEPFALEDLPDADLAASHVMRTIALAAKPRPVDDENVDEFCDRWAGLLADAYRGRLEHPRYLPLP